MNRKIWLWILSGLVILVTLFIFSNSLKGITASTEDSDSVISVFDPLIRWIFGENHGIDLHFWIRKTAHFVEFAVLGIFVTAHITLWKQKKSPAFYGYGLFYLLAVGVTDEFIQRFFERTSSVNDVLLDFSGALLGFGLVLLTVLFINKKRGK